MATFRRYWISAVCLNPPMHIFLSTLHPPAALFSKPTSHRAYRLPCPGTRMQLYSNTMSHRHAPYLWQCCTVHWIKACTSLYFWRKLSWKRLASSALTPSIPDRRSFPTEETHRKIETETTDTKWNAVKVKCFGWEGENKDWCYSFFIFITVIIFKNHD